MSTACLDACPVEISPVPLLQETAGQILALRPGDTIAIDPQEGLRITAVEGAAWVTQTGDPRDTIVRGARSFVPSPRGRVVIQALGAPARVRLATHPAPI